MKIHDVYVIVTIYGNSRTYTVIRDVFRFHVIYVVVCVRIEFCF